VLHIHEERYIEAEYRRKELEGQKLNKHGTEYTSIELPVGREIVQYSERKFS